jgi:hypothetical protein
VGRGRYKSEDTKQQICRMIKIRDLIYKMRTADGKIVLSIGFMLYE